MNENGTIKEFTKEISKKEKAIIKVLAKSTYNHILVGFEECEDRESLARYVEIIQTLYKFDCNKAAALILLILKECTYDNDLLTATFETCKPNDRSTELFVSEFIYYHFYG